MEHIYAPHSSKTYGRAGNFGYSEETIWNNFRNLIALKYNIYLSKGKASRHADKKLNNADNDSGLTKYNTAK